MNPALTTSRDGNYDIFGTAGAPLTSGEVYYETIDGHRGLVVTHQPIVQSVGSITQPAGGDFITGFGYFWKDTPRRELGDDVVQFERLYHNIPGDFDAVVDISKDFQAGDYTFNNGQLSGVAIISFSRAIKATCNYHYALDDPGALPVKPFIQIIPFLSGQVITDLGTGFPYANFNGSNLPNNNFASSFITGSYEYPLGLSCRLTCRKRITG